MQKQNEYDNKRKKTLRWGYLFAVGALCVFVMFLARIVVLQNTNVQ
jgi:cell division protein FtsI (penicillin-binding protein 3)